LVEARRSSSRERRVLGKGTTGSFALTVRAGRVTHLAAEGTSDRESARLSQGPRGTDLGGLRATEWVQRKRPNTGATEEATGVSETVMSVAHGGRKRPRASLARPSKWESRCEPRLSPASFASGGPSCPVLAESVFGPAKARARKETFRVNEHEPRGSVRVGFPCRTPKGALVWIKGLSAGKRRLARVLELNGFGVQKSIGTHPRPRRLLALPSAGRHARTSSNESYAAQ
jgi:hypothetical protein